MTWWIRGQTRMGSLQPLERNWSSMPSELSNLAGLATLKSPPPPPLAEQAPGRAASPLAVETPRGKGRPPGKRSDPDYQPTTVLLRKHTKKTASRLLEDIGTGKDLSELIEQLLTGWIQQNS
jgi:hypothetical protein